MRVSRHNSLSGRREILVLTVVALSLSARAQILTADNEALCGDSECVAINMCPAVLKLVFKVGLTALLSLW